MQLNHNVAIVIPPVVVHNQDPHTGIPFMPHIAASLAGNLRRDGYNIQILDSFGLQPHNRQILGEFMLLGRSEEWIAQNIDPAVKVCLIYCRTISEFVTVNRLIEQISKYHLKMKFCLFENTQAVTSYSLRDLPDNVVHKKIDVLILGEPETRTANIIDSLINDLPLSEIPGIIFKSPEGFLQDTVKYSADFALDELALPAWDIWQLQGYWIANFAHAPVKKGVRFLPLLTSRGCPYHCRFCVAPSLNSGWRARSAINLVDEIQHFTSILGVTDYHISDLNPTVNDQRTKAICKEIITRDLKITWKLAQGTKIETIKSMDTLLLMAKAGCKFISFSPESGSKRMLDSINKPFDFDHALAMTAKMNLLDIRSQACFIAGLPGEDGEARWKSLEFVKKLIAAGLDEINVPIFTPVPGADFSKKYSGYTHYSQCTFSPTWRSDFKDANNFRRRMYLTFFLYKLTKPRKVFRELAGFFSLNFETKMEMSIHKIIKLYLLRYFPWLFRRLPMPVTGFEYPEQVSKKRDSGQK